MLLCPGICCTQRYANSFPLSLVNNEIGKHTAFSDWPLPLRVDPAQLHQQAGSITLPWAVLELLKYWFLQSRRIHTLKNQYSSAHNRTGGPRPTPRPSKHCRQALAEEGLGGRRRQCPGRGPCKPGEGSDKQPSVEREKKGKRREERKDPSG